MLATGVIFLVDDVEWVSLIVIQNKKDYQEIWVCVDYMSLNNAYIHDCFLTPFNDEVLNNVVGNEAYSFTYWFFGYHQVCIIEEDNRKTTFMTKWGYYAYHFMPFGIKNMPTVFLRIVITAFQDYLHRFLKVYMDYWTV